MASLGNMGAQIIGACAKIISKQGGHVSMLCGVKGACLSWLGSRKKINSSIWRAMRPKKCNHYVEWW